MNKTNNAQKDRLCSESAENCRKTIRILEKAIDPNCQVTFNHRGWCGFPRLQVVRRTPFKTNLSVLVARPAYSRVDFVD